MSKANREEAHRLARLSSDCSFLLTHMIRQNTRPERTNDEARNILRSILDIENYPPKNTKLIGSDVGWYSRCSSAYIYRPENNDYLGECDTKAVCFTESTLAGLRAHREVFKVKYGVAFDREYLFSRGANPCLNIRDDILNASLGKNPQKKGGTVASYGPRDLHLYNHIPSQLLPFINIINSSFDATHEREWRYVGDLSFEYSDLMFVFCPEDDFEIFHGIQKKGKPVLFDLAWLDRV